jgi:hypothetical protein
MSRLTTTLSHYWDKIQASLFPWLAEELDPLTEKQQQLVEILELIRVEQFLTDLIRCEGRPPKTRSAIAWSFIAKMIYNMDSTVALIERLKTDKNMRRICGWESLRQLPSESTFSRAFAEFAETSLPQRAHDALIAKTLITSCYDLMDAGYDVDAIVEHSRSLGHVPLIDKNPRRDQKLQRELKAENLARRNLNFTFPEELRYNERTTAERANARLKDEFGANKLRVRGHAKVACHLMFGVLVLAADQLMKLAM